MWIAGVELDLRKAWQHRRELCHAGFAKWSSPDAGAVVAAPAGRATRDGWGQSSHGNLSPASWHDVRSNGVPILILLMEKWKSCARRWGSASSDTQASTTSPFWGVLALVLMELGIAHWQTGGISGGLCGRHTAGAVQEASLTALAARDPLVPSVWYLARLRARWGPTGAGLHFWWVRSFAGAVTESRWFDRRKWICCATMCCSR